MWKKNHPSATRWPVAVASECGERRLRGETALGPCQHRRAHLIGIGELQWGWCGGHVRAARAAALVHHVPHLHLHHVVCAQRSHEHKQTCKSEVDTLRHGTKVQCLGFSLLYYRKSLGSTKKAHRKNPLEMKARASNLYAQLGYLLKQLGYLEKKLGHIPILHSPQVHWLEITNCFKPIVKHKISSNYGNFRVLFFKKMTE